MKTRFYSPAATTTFLIFMSSFLSPSRKPIIFRIISQTDSFKIRSYLEGFRSNFLVNYLVRLFYIMGSLYATYDAGI